MPTKVTFRDRDKGMKKLGRMLRRQGSGKGPGVLVGILADKDNSRSDDLTNVQLGTIHEFGLGNVPERSFVRSTIDAKQSEHRRLVRQLANKVASGQMSQKTALGLFGSKVVADIQATIRAKIPPKLTDETLFRKSRGEGGGGNPKQTPLINTGQLINSISFKVVGV